MHVLLRWSPGVSFAAPTLLPSVGGLGSLEGRRSGSISRRMRRNSEGQEEWKEAMMEILGNTLIVGKTIKFSFMSVLRTVC